MRTRIGNHELDAWADEFGVHNDADAISALTRVQNRVAAAGDELGDCLSEVPEGARGAKLTSEVRAWLATAQRNVEEATYYLKAIKTGFERHERGES